MNNKDFYRVWTVFDTVIDNETTFVEIKYVVVNVGSHYIQSSWYDFNKAAVVCRDLNTYVAKRAFIAKAQLKKDNTE